MNRPPTSPAWYPDPVGRTPRPATVRMSDPARLRPVPSRPAGASGPRAMATRQRGRVRRRRRSSGRTPVCGCGRRWGAGRCGGPRSPPRTVARLPMSARVPDRGVVGADLVQPRGALRAAIRSAGLQFFSRIPALAECTLLHACARGLHVSRETQCGFATAQWVCRGNFYNAGQLFQRPSTSLIGVRPQE